MVRFSSPASCDIVFMTPPVSLEERYGSLAASGNYSPCLASLWLSAQVRKAGFTVGIIDAAAEGLSESAALKRLTLFQPKVLAFTTTTLTTMPADRFARRVKEQWKDVTVWVGGPQATAVPEDTLQQCTHFDGVAIHEGEITILDLMENLIRNNKDISDIAGIAYRNSDGEILVNPPRPVIDHLDSLPFPAWDLLAGFPRRYKPGFYKVKKTPSTSFVASRGCPYECSFCDTSVFGKKIRSHSAEYMVELFKHLHHTYRINDVTFEDDTFMVNKKNVVRFCELLLHENLRMSWACNSRVNLAKPDLLRCMKEAGCWHISYGIESGSQDILNQESKHQTIQQIEEGIQNTVNAGIAAKGFFILGHPNETQATLQETYRFIQKLPLADISVSFMTPFPGSPLSKNAHEFGRFQNDWTKMNLLTPVFVPHGLTESDLSYWHKKIIRDFYCRPKVIAAYAQRLLHNPSPTFIKGLIQSGWAIARSTFHTKPIQ